MVACRARVRRAKTAAVTTAIRVAATVAVLVGLCLSFAPRLPDVDHDGVVRIACLGDSLTQDGWPTGAETRWCTRAGALASADGGAARRTVWTSYGAGGATVCDPGVTWPWAQPQLASALAHGADVIVAAFGTNDIGVFDRPPAAIVACYRALAAQVTGGRAFFVALTPPVYLPDGGTDARVDALNAAIRAAFPAEQVLDFHSGMGPELYAPGGKHLNDAGQAERARRAVAALH